MKPKTTHHLVASLLGCAALGASSSALAQNAGEPVLLEFDAELQSVKLSGGPFAFPLASDPGNALGDSVAGYGFVNSSVQISLSSQRDPAGPASPGKAFASNGIAENARAAGVGPTTQANGAPAPINPAQLDGQRFFVNTFFDVFFDVTLTDVDARPGRDFAGQPDKAVLMLLDVGPTHMESFHSVVFDQNAPNFGLIPPPEAAPYIGHFSIEIPWGGDINGNDENDKIKFTLATHALGDENRTFIVLPDGTVIDQFDSAAFLEGAVVDESTDPPFRIGQLDPNTGLPDANSFGGPTTGSSRLLNPVVPEPKEWSLILGTGLLGFASYRRLRAGNRA